MISLQLFLRQSVLSININSPIGELLVLLNQSFCDYLIDAKQMSNTLFTNFSTELKKANKYRIWYEIKCGKLLSQIMRRSSIFKENRIFIEEKDNPSDKVVIVEEELDDVDIDGIGNLVDLPRLMLIDQQCGNLKILENRKKISEVLQTFRC